MITPNEIKAKVKRLYPDAVDSWLKRDVGYFPHRIPANMQLPTTQSETIAVVDSLRSDSKESIGFGYSIEWEQVHSRSKGNNRFPKGVWLESMEDLLRLIGKGKEFRSLERSVDSIRKRLPNLETWLRKGWSKLPPIESHLDGLIQVVEYLLQHPRPGCFPRELPLNVPTKLVSQNQAVLSEWLDILLPPHTIDAGCNPRNFAARYGFREVRDHLLFRILDPNLQNELGLPSSELSLLPIDLDRLPVNAIRVFIVENKVNLLTFPPVSRGLVFGGLGHGVTQLFPVRWMDENPIWYWGDLDVEGYHILASVRHRFPHTKSFLMTEEVLQSYRSLCTAGKGRTLELPDELQPSEAAGYLRCREENLRLEQEHIPQSSVLRALDEINLTLIRPRGTF